MATTQQEIAANALLVADVMAKGEMFRQFAGPATLICEQYGILLACMDKIIKAVDRGFGEASFTQDRVLLMMRNNIPVDLRPLFVELPD